MQDLFIDFISKPEPELNEMIDTGAFNEIIKGYLVVALRNTGAQRGDIMESLTALEAAFDTTDAEQARRAYRELFSH